MIASERECKDCFASLAQTLFQPSSEGHCLGWRREGKTWKKKPRTCGFSLHLFSFLLSFHWEDNKESKAKEHWFLPIMPHKGGPAHTRSVHQRCNSPALGCARCGKRITSMMEVKRRTSIHGTSSLYQSSRYSKMRLYPCGDQHSCQVTPIRQPSSPSGCGTNGPNRA